MPTRNNRAFTLIELLVVISIIALLISILLPALSSARRTARMLENGTRMRGVHQGLVISAQDNDGYYVGWNGSALSAAADNLANELGGTVEARFSLLIQDDYTTPDYLISPGETDTDVKAYSPNDTAFINDHFSYGMLGITTNGWLGNSTHRRKEWRDNVNTRSVIIADRLIEIPGDWNNPGTYKSFWSPKPGKGAWYTAWNDNHIEASTSAFLDDTEYGTVKNTVDNLYDRRIGTAEYGNVQSVGSATVDGDNSGTCKIVAKGNEANIK